MFDQIFSDDFMPHGFCYLWKPELVWLHALSDLTIALAYFAIPVTLLIILRMQKRVLPFSWVFAMFATFIFFCGLTHIISLVAIWKPVYYFEGIVKVITAAVSIATAMVMFPLIPYILKKLEEMEQMVKSTEDR